MRKSALALALTLATLVPVAAHAGSKTQSHTKIIGNSAVANWDFTDGNIGTFVNVVVTDNNTSGTNGLSQDAFVALSISQYEVDTGNVLITGSAFVDGSANFTFTVDKDLGSATLDVHNAIFEDDNSFTFFNVDMHLTWTATADATTQKSHSNIKEPGLHVITRFEGVFRDAVANGSVFGKNIQFTPVPSSDAQLQHNTFGEVDITTSTP